MAEKYCESCESLQEYAANFLLNGITEKECESLGKNTGLNPDLTVLHENCEDLHDVLNCLLGAFSEKLKAVDLCDKKKLKTFLGELMGNMFNINKAIICSDCGQWEAIKKLWIEIEKIYELITIISGGGNYKTLTKGVDFDVDFYNGYNTPNNDWYVGIIELHDRVFVRSSHMTHPDAFVRNSNMYNLTMTHGKNINSDPLSRVVKVRFLGQYAYLNVSPVLQHTPTNTIWNVQSQTSWPGSWTMYQSMSKALDESGYYIYPVSFADGHNTDFKHYGNGVSGTWLSTLGEVVVAKPNE